MDRASQNVERMGRQRRIDASVVEPVWRKNVDATLLELSLANPLPSNPVLLMPELRMASLLKSAQECFPKQIKMMIVDHSNSRFDFLRQSIQTSSSTYFSTQLLNALNYSGNVFDIIISHISLSSLLRFELILPEYYRVLKPNGIFTLSAPLSNTLDLFFDMLRESLIKTNFPNTNQIMEHITTLMSKDCVNDLLEKQNFSVLDREEIKLSISFPSIEDFLFSTLVESFYLSICLNLSSEEEGKKLLANLIKSFHHYFQELPVTAKFHMQCLLCQKKE